MKKWRDVLADLLIGLASKVDSVEEVVGDPNPISSLYSGTSAFLDTWIEFHVTTGRCDSCEKEGEQVHFGVENEGGYFEADWRLCGRCLWSALASWTDGPPR